MKFEYFTAAFQFKIPVSQSYTQNPEHLWLYLQYDQASKNN
jgi:hypothetical protein